MCKCNVPMPREKDSERAVPSCVIDREGVANGNARSFCHTAKEDTPPPWR